MPQLGKCARATPRQAAGRVARGFANLGLEFGLTERRTLRLRRYGKPQSATLRCDGDSLLDHCRHSQLLLPVGPEEQRPPHKGEPRGGRTTCGRGPPSPPGQQVGRPVDVRPPCRAPSGTFAHSSPMSPRTPSLLATRSIMPSIPGSPSVKRMPSPAYWSSAIVTSSATAGVPPGQTSSSLSR